MTHSLGLCGCCFWPSIPLCQFRSVLNSSDEHSQADFQNCLSSEEQQQNQGGKFLEIDLMSFLCLRRQSGSSWQLLGWLAILLLRPDCQSLGGCWSASTRACRGLQGTKVTSVTLCVRALHRKCSSFPEWFAGEVLTVGANV